MANYDNSRYTYAQVLRGTGYYMKDDMLRYSSGVSTMQTKLNTAGYNCGTPDGKFGNGTNRAVLNFQGAHSLTKDGKAGRNTLNALEAATSGGGSSSTVNGWLYLKSKKSQSGGRDVSMPSSCDPNKWAMREGNPYNGGINPYAGRATVRTGNHGELIDGNGRYWIAVGPNVMNPSHSKSKSITAEEMKYQSKIDIVLKDSSGKTHYVYAIVGDCKAHTYPTGIVQTGNAFPNGTDSHPANADGSVVEFLGTQSISGLRNYSIEKMIVY